MMQYIAQKAIQARSINRLLAVHKFWFSSLHISAVGTGRGGGAIAPTDLGRYLNPISIRGANYAPPPIFYLPTALHLHLPITI